MDIPDAVLDLCILPFDDWATFEDGGKLLPLDAKRALKSLEVRNWQRSDFESDVVDGPFDRGVTFEALEKAGPDGYVARLCHPPVPVKRSGALTDFVFTALMFYRSVGPDEPVPLRTVPRAFLDAALGEVAAAIHGQYPDLPLFPDSPQKNANPVAELLEEIAEMPLDCRVDAATICQRLPAPMKAALQLLSENVALDYSALAAKVGVPASDLAAQFAALYERLRACVSG